MTNRMRRFFQDNSKRKQKTLKPNLLAQNNQGQFLSTQNRLFYIYEGQIRSKKEKIGLLYKEGDAFFSPLSLIILSRRSKKREEAGKTHDLQSNDNRNIELEYRGFLIGK